MRTIGRPLYKTIGRVIGKGAHLGSKLKYEPELRTYLAGLTVPLSFDQKYKLNKLIVDWKTVMDVNLLSDFADVIRIRAVETAEARLRNIAKDAHHATAVNSPLFTALEGDKGNGSSSYIDENFNPSTDSDKYTLNSASIITYIRDNIAEDSCDVGVRQSSTSRASYILPRTASNLAISKINANNSPGISEANNDSRGMFVSTRNSDSEFSLYRNKTLIKTLAAVSSELPPYDFYSLCLSEVFVPKLFSTRQNSLLILCKGISKTEIDGITDAFEVYMDSNGKGVMA